MSLPIEDPILLVNPDPSDPDMAGLHAIVLNVYMPIKDASGAPTGEYRFQLPKPAPKLVALAVPPSVILALPRATDPAPLATPFPASCVYEDQSLRAQLPGFEFGQDSDPFSGFLNQILFTRVCNAELTYTSSNASVAQVVLENGKPVLKAYAPGETMVHARYDGVSNDSVVRVVQTPPTSAGAFGASTQPTLLEPVAIEGDRLDASTSVHQTLTHKVRVRPAARVKLDGVATACSGVTTSGNSRIVGPVIANAGDAVCDPVSLIVSNFVQNASLHNANAIATFPKDSLSSSGALNLKGNDVLTLPEGVFYFTSVELTGNSKLITSVGTKIAVSGSFKMTGNSTVSGPSEWFLINSPSPPGGRGWG